MGLNIAKSAMNQRPGIQSTNTLEIPSLLEWEMELIHKIKSHEIGITNQAGALQFLVPNHAKWDEFKSTVRNYWQKWKDDLNRYPVCLLLLYSGIAFYEYDDNKFWRFFANAVGDASLTDNQRQQSKINEEFRKMTEILSLNLRGSEGRKAYVDTSIYFIGIPLTLWDGFLTICEWALQRTDWEKLADDEWKDLIERRCRGQTRLSRFLVNNRDLATIYLKDMLDLRECSNPGNMIEASLIRKEYFEEVPETAEFLSPNNPDALLKDTVSLVWKQETDEICLHLPGVSQEKLPATWNACGYSKRAGVSPGEIVINSAAFCNSILLTLEYEESTTQNKVVERSQVPGLNPWGLYDCENCHFIRTLRDELPLKSYVLFSQMEIGVVKATGFNLDEAGINVEYHFADDSICYITNLYPTEKYAEINIAIDNNSPRKLSFKPRSKIRCELAIGRDDTKDNHFAAYFCRNKDGKIRMDHLPKICVTIPKGYFKDNQKEVKYFEVLMDNEWSANGSWEKRNLFNNEEDYYFWNWSWSPFSKGASLNSFKDLHEAFKLPNLKGDHKIKIQRGSTVYSEFEFEYVDSIDEIDQYWKNLPGDYLLMYLLSQSIEGLTWDKFTFAKDVIAPGAKFPAGQKEKYVNSGYLDGRGKTWRIIESRFEIIQLTQNEIQLNYCGDLSVLWGLYRRLYQLKPFSQTFGNEHDNRLATINIVNQKGLIPPYLRINWPASLTDKISKYLKRHNVIRGDVSGINN
jgi:hypothetical protein